MRVECALSYGESLVGHTIGPNLEVHEALAVLEGATEPNSLIQKSLSIAGIALEMAGKAAYGQGFDMAADLLRSGKALEKMRQIIEVQGGDPTVKAEDIVPGEYRFDVRAPQDGYVIELNNQRACDPSRGLRAPPTTTARGLTSTQRRGPGSGRVTPSLPSTPTGNGGLSAR